MKTLVLELCVECPEDIVYARKEGRKLAVEVQRLAPSVQLQVLTRVARDIYPAYPDRQKHPNWTVPNENPLVGTHQCLLLTYTTLRYPDGRIVEGLAGATKGCVNIENARNAGDASVEIIAHEWLHTISHITGVDPDHGEKLGCTRIKVNNRDYWTMVDGTEWNAWILSSLVQ